MKKFLFALALLTSTPALAQEQGAPSQSPWAVTSLTLAGGPIWSKHFQPGKDHYNTNHTIGIATIGTRDRGNWALYYLGPNSVDDTSIGFGYVTDPYVLPLGGPVNLELRGALGLVTGYQDYPLPMLAGQARLAFYEDGPLNVGLEAAAMPYISDGRHSTGGNKFGIVATTPFLSARYTY